MNSEVMKSQGTAQRVLAIASRLFYEHGVRAIGMERLVAESGIAKTSVYRHFHTKDDLVAAFLTLEDQQFWLQWDEIVAGTNDDILAALLALLDWIGQRVSRDNYRGCPQINVAAEFADPEHPARKIRRQHKAQMHKRLKYMAHKLNVVRPGELAQQLVLLIDGAFMSDGRLSKSVASKILQSAGLALVRAQQTHHFASQGHSGSSK